MMLAPLLALLAALAVAPAAGAVGAGDAAPPLVLRTGAGEEIDLARLRGSVVYVDFWASWCGPCKRSFPWMNEVARKHAGRGFAIVAVNVDKRREDAERFLKALPAAFTVVYDASGSVPAAWQVKAMPSSYLVDRTGKVLLVEHGFKDDRKADVEERIRAALDAR